MVKWKGSDLEKSFDDIPEAESNDTINSTNEHSKILQKDTELMAEKEAAETEEEKRRIQELRDKLCEEDNKQQDKIGVNSKK